MDTAVIPATDSVAFTPLEPANPVSSRGREISAEHLYRVSGRWKGKPFCCGAVSVNNMVVRTAPLLHNRQLDLVLRSVWEAEDMVRSRGWTWERVTAPAADTHSQLMRIGRRRPRDG